MAIYIDRTYGASVHPEACQSKLLPKPRSDSRQSSTSDVEEHLQQRGVL
jgi:hypothetical protein